MTVTLNPQTEARLRERAQREGQDLDTVVDALLVSQLDWEAQEFEEAVAGIQRGLQAAAEGKVRPFDDYLADVTRRRQQRDLAITEQTEAVMGIRLGLGDFAAGRYSTAAEAFAEIRVRHGISD